VRVVDAVKGPYYPSPPPFPTFTLKPEEVGQPRVELFAPVSETDRGKLKEPEDAY
jgi:hypothetical protein